MNQLAVAVTKSDIIEWLKAGNYDVALSSTHEYCGYALLHKAGVGPVVSFVYEQAYEELLTSHPSGTVIVSFGGQVGQTTSENDVIGGMAPCAFKHQAKIPKRLQTLP